MKKHFKILSVITAIFLVLTAFAGCGKNDSGDPAQNQGAKKQEAKELIVWSHLKDDTEVPEVEKVALEWAEKTGHKVKVMFSQSEFQDYVQAASGNRGPDIMFGMPHNDLGVFQRLDLLAQVPDDFIDQSHYVDMAIEATMYDGKMYAIPLSMEAMALFYNTDMIQTPPDTFEEFIELAQEAGFMYHIPDLYSSYAFLAGNGAYVFKNTKGAYDPEDIGLGNEGAVKGFELLYKFVNEYAFMSADCTGDIARGNFQSGKTGFMLGGPWDVEGFRNEGVPFSVAPMPKLNGNIMPTYVGVQAAFVSAKSKKQPEAWDLMKYLVENTPGPLLEKGHRIPVLKSELERPEVKDNKIIAAFAKQASHGDPIPNIPETNATWTPVGNAIRLVISGQISPEQAAADVIKQIEEGIAIQNQQ